MNSEAEPLVVKLEQFAEAMPPPRPVDVQVGWTGSRARDQRFINIKRSDAESDLVDAVLAHEYGHIVDPHMLRFLRLQRRLLIAAPATAAAMAILALIRPGGDVAAGAIGALVVAGFVVLCARFLAESRRGEYRADAIAAQILGADQVHVLEQWLGELADRRRCPWPEAYDTHPHPQRRVEACSVVRQQSARR
jgi:predicted Zn-dependent protease